jgi:KaiC/GvpD/RAD55 family RecA-like ATPase
VNSITQAVSSLTYKESFPFGLIILSGGSGTGKTIFAQQYAYETVQDGGQALWITTEELPDTLRANMSRFGWGLDRYESEGRFQFIDAVSPARLGLSENLGNGVLGLDPTGILIAISEQVRQAVSSGNSGKYLVIMDSLSRLLLSVDTKSVIDFVSCLSSRLENYKTRGIVTVTDGAHDERTLNALTFSSTGTVRFRINEMEDHRIRQLRIETLRGMRHDDSWKNYAITKTGFALEV